MGLCHGRSLGAAGSGKKICASQQSHLLHWSHSPQARGQEAHGNCGYLNCSQHCPPSCLLHNCLSCYWTEFWSFDVESPGQFRRSPTESKKVQEAATLLEARLLPQCLHPVCERGGGGEAGPLPWRKRGGWQEDRGRRLQLATTPEAKRFNTSHSQMRNGFFFSTTGTESQFEDYLVTSIDSRCIGSGCFKN